MTEAFLVAAISAMGVVAQSLITAKATITAAEIDADVKPQRRNALIWALPMGVILFFMVLMAGRLSPPAEPTALAAQDPTDVHQLFEAGFSLGIAYTWASVGAPPAKPETCPDNLKGAVSNFGSAHTALTRSRAFADMTAADELDSDALWDNLTDCAVAKSRLGELKNQLSRQLENRN